MKKIVFGFFVGAALTGFLGVPFAAHALAVEDIQVKIRALLEQVAQLQAQTRLQQDSQIQSSPTDASRPAPHRICSILHRNLGLGSRGDDVAGLQEYLMERGYFSGTSTGYFGPITSRAVAAWQASVAVSSVGSIGPLSRERIRYWCGEFGGNRELFSVIPAKGDAPLAVTFSTWFSSFRIRSVYYMIDYGDGVAEQASECLAPADACTKPGQNKHTYTAPGTYIATLNKITNPCAGIEAICKAAMQSEVVGKVQIRVGPSACTKEYRPVCGAKPIQCITAPCNPVPTTYANTCLMNSDNATFLYNGQCRDVVANPESDPACKAWYDGCNTCSRSAPGAPAMCTLMACIDQGNNPPKAYCKAYFDDSSTSKPPTISGFSGPTSLAVQAVGTWIINASDPENGQLSYQISWGDESVYPGGMSAVRPTQDIVQTTTFTHSYLNAGTYTVTIVVRDSAGKEAMTTATVHVGSLVACTLQYDPVCGRPVGCMNSCPTGMYCAMMCQQHPLRTYGNKCQLEAAGAEFVYVGECAVTTP